jgi:hypothetical protein
MFVPPEGKYRMGDRERDIERGGMELVFGLLLKKLCGSSFN